MSLNSVQKWELFKTRLQYVSHQELGRDASELIHLGQSRIPICHRMSKQKGRRSYQLTHLLFLSLYMLGLLRKVCWQFTGWGVWHVRSRTGALEFLALCDVNHPPCGCIFDAMAHLLPRPTSREENVVLRGTGSKPLQAEMTKQITNPSFPIFLLNFHLRKFTKSLPRWIQDEAAGYPARPGLGGSAAGPCVAPKWFDFRSSTTSIGTFPESDCCAATCVLFELVCNKDFLCTCFFTNLDQNHHWIFGTWIMDWILNDVWKKVYWGCSEVISGRSWRENIESMKHQGSFLQLQRFMQFMPWHVLKMSKMSM